MTKWIVFFVLTFVVNGAQKQDQPPPSKDLNAVLRDHLGDASPKHTDTLKGQLSTVRDSRSLKCGFSQLEPCCWYNVDSPTDDLDWVVVDSPVDAPRFRSRYGGKFVHIPQPPFAVTAAASQSSSERAMMISCAIPCQAGPGQLTVEHWLDAVELNVCRMRVGSKTIVEPCGSIKGTGRSTVWVDSLPEPFYVTIMATGFGPDGLAVIDNVEYSARIPPQC